MVEQIGISNEELNKLQLLLEEITGQHNGLYCLTRGFTNSSSHINGDKVPKDLFNYLDKYPSFKEFCKKEEDTFKFDVDKFLSLSVDDQNKFMLDLCRYLMNEKGFSFKHVKQLIRFYRVRSDLILYRYQPFSTDDSEFRLNITTSQDQLIDEFKFTKVVSIDVKKANKYTARNSDDTLMVFSGSHCYSKFGASLWGANEEVLKESITRNLDEINAFSWLSTDIKAFVEKLTEELAGLSKDELIKVNQLTQDISALGQYVTDSSNKAHFAQQVKAILDKTLDESDASKFFQLYISILNKIRDSQVGIKELSKTLKDIESETQKILRKLDEKDILETTKNKIRVLRNRFNMLASLLREHAGAIIDNAALDKDSKNNALKKYLPIELYNKGEDKSTVLPSGKLIDQQIAQLALDRLASRMSSENFRERYPLAITPLRSYIHATRSELSKLEDNHNLTEAEKNYQRRVHANTAYNLNKMFTEETSYTAKNCLQDLKKDFDYSTIQLSRATSGSLMAVGAIATAVCIGAIASSVLTLGIGGGLIAAGLLTGALGLYLYRKNEKKAQTRFWSKASEVVDATRTHEKINSAQDNTRSNLALVFG